MTQHDYYFGKSSAALYLEDLVKNDAILRRKTMRFMSAYNQFVDEVMTLKTPAIIKKILDMPYPCEFDAPAPIKTLCQNLMAIKKREALKKLD